MMWRPKRFHIESTVLCNSNCVTCPHEKITRDKIIDIPRIKKLITDDIKNNYGDIIELIEFHNYNEPLLTLDIFFELVELANKTFGPGKIGLVTNGSIMNPVLADRLIDAHLKHIIFSIDGFSKEVFEKTRRGLDRDTVYNNVDYFIERSRQRGGVVPNINFIVTRENRGDISLVKEYFGQKRCTVWINGCNGRGGFGREPYRVDNFIEEPCDYALENVYILSNLDVVPCCNDWAGLAVMGNLRDKTLKEIVEGEKFEDFRTKQFSRRKREIELCRFCTTNLSIQYQYMLARY